MFKYTAAKSILHDLRKIRRTPFSFDKEIHFINQFVQNYAQYIAFKKGYDGFVFYSKDRLLEIPLKGILFASDLFDSAETK